MCDPCQPICYDPCCEPICCPEPCPPMCCPSPCPPPCAPCCPPACPPKRCKSRELKGSVLLTHCECVRRNGLQFDCPRTECKGRPLCTVKPWAACCPSKYSWRYTNITMGKPSNPPRCVMPKAPSCDPCCMPCDPCDPCFTGC